MQELIYISFLKISVIQSIKIIAHYLFNMAPNHKQYSTKGVL
jgi:hypothetical protein